jgi:transcriptional regulator with XRE-family HTH domain
MAKICRKLHSPSSRFLRYPVALFWWQNAAMDVRDRIKVAIAAKPGQTVRSVSLAAGLSDSMLNKFLSGQTDSMTLKTCEKLADALGVDVRWLAFGEGDPEQASDVADKIRKLSVEQQTLIENMVDQLTRASLAA